MRSQTPLLLAVALLISGCVDDRIQITPNSDPEAAILEPAPDAEFEPGEDIGFRGEVQDGQTSGPQLDVTWSSSRDGILSEGFADDEGTTTFATTSLTVGEHTITLRVVDGDGASATDAITITIAEEQVENTAPTCAITNPADDDVFTESDTVVLEALVDDAQSAPAELAVRWSSSEDGDLGTATPSSSGDAALPVSLTVGTHVLTLDVDDPDGLSCSEFVVVEVVPDNLPPSVGAPTVTPNPLLTTTDATCTVPTPTDPEGDTVNLAITWQIGGTDVPGATGATLGSSAFVKGDTVTCTATPSDAVSAGTPAVSPGVPVADTAPTAPVVQVSPSAPEEGIDALSCAVTTPSVDADGEAVAYSVAWTLDGVAWTGATSTGSITGDGIPGADTVAGTWTCTVTPFAGGVAGASGSDSVTVAPPAPIGKTVFVTSTRHTGNLGGVTGADSICQARANSAGLAGTFKAWLSGGSSSSAPASRFTYSSVPYVRTDGVQVAADWADLTDGAIDAPINVDENGNTPSGGNFVWSYTRINGTKGLFDNPSYACYGSDCHCANWTTTQTQGNPIQGSAVAQWNEIDDDWTDYSYGNFCGSEYRLYCFEQ